MAQPPILKDSEHIFFKLSDFSAWLQDWTQSGVLPAALANKFKEWFADGLQDWDISRDAPYHGFEIPGHPDKYFYVWFDAPIGYIAATQEVVKDQDTIPHLWHPESKTEIHHFIGKDIAYFHGLFWPAVLKSASSSNPARFTAMAF